MADASSRIRAVDWLRGVAVLFMLQTHAYPLLRPELLAHGDPIYSRLVRLDGLVAPSFIFAAGFSLALVQIRGARSGNRKGQAKKSAKRITEVLAVATLLNVIWFPVFHLPKWFLYVDILHCIALSLFIALPLMVSLSSRPGVFRLCMLGFAALVFGLAPFAEGARGPLAFLINSSPAFADGRGSLFPLSPWAGYVFLGASAGATAAMGSEKGLKGWLGLLLGVGALLWIFDGTFMALYPKHNFWVTNPANHGQRWALVVGLVLLFRFGELGWSRLAESAPVKFLSGFGTSSLSAYFWHLMVLFLPIPWLPSMSKLWRDSLTWPQYFVRVGLLIALTYLLVRLTDLLDPKVRALFSRKRAAAPAKA